MLQRYITRTEAPAFNGMSVSELGREYEGSSGFKRGMRIVQGIGAAIFALGEIVDSVPAQAAGLSFVAAAEYAVRVTGGMQGAIAANLPNAIRSEEV